MAEEQKTENKKMQERLTFEPGNCWDKANPGELDDCEDLARDYKTYLDGGKTEREFTRLCAGALEQAGFINLDGEEARGLKELKSGDKVYRRVRDKALFAAVVGRRPPREGVNILGAHADAPRIDLKTNPLYEDTGLALLDTHYYGGIKHYQWTAIPLAMHGVIIGRDGARRDISLGEDDGDPVFTVTDLLPHLARDQMAKKASDFIDGEGLDILAGSRPLGEKELKERVKLRCLSILHEAYGVTEEDFAAAEIEFVPAFKARDLGLDRSMIGAYGHDDRSCAFAAFRALLDESAASRPEKTQICYLSDKEEIGSMGNTGAQSRGLENFIALLCALTAPPSQPASSYTTVMMELRDALARSSMLSADVNAAFDPTREGAFDREGDARLGCGPALFRYWGAPGKTNTNEAPVETVALIRRILDEAGVLWQSAEGGRVGIEDSGTLSRFFAALDIPSVDLGVALLSMHSPFEAAAKADIYLAFRAYQAFFERKSESGPAIPGFVPRLA